MSVDTVADELRKPFSKEIIKRNPKGMSYIPVSEVIARLNYALGENNWSYQVIDVREHGGVSTDTGSYPKWLTAQVRLSAHFPSEPSPVSFPDYNIHRDGFGGQEVQFLKNGSGPVDLGDAFKGAVSDALKKAAQSLGVALDLARTDEALTAERDNRSAGEPKATEEMLANIAAKAKSLDEAPKKRFNAWWKENVGNAPDSGLVTYRQANKALNYLGLDIFPEPTDD